MKTVVNIIRNITICIIAVLFMTGCFFGAVLQESYKLSPVTAAEVAE